MYTCRPTLFSLVQTSIHIEYAHFIFVKKHITLITHISCLYTKAIHVYTYVELLHFLLDLKSYNMHVQYKYVHSLNIGYTFHLNLTHYKYTLSIHLNWFNQFIHTVRWIYTSHLEMTPQTQVECTHFILVQISTCNV